MSRSSGSLTPPGSSVAESDLQTAGVRAGALTLQLSWKFLEGDVCTLCSMMNGGVLLLKAGMHAGNTCMTEIYSCSPSCLCRLQNWVTLCTGAYLRGVVRAVLFFIFLFIYKNALKGTKASGVLGVPKCFLPSSWPAAHLTRSWRG